MTFLDLFRLTKNTQSETSVMIEDQNQLFKSFFELHPDAVYSLDRSGYLMNANRAFERISGYQINQMGEISFQSFVVAGDLMKYKQHFEKVMEGVSQNFKVSIQHQDGYHVHINITNIPIMSNNEIIGICGFVKDLTEQKRMDASLSSSKDSHYHTQRTTTERIQTEQGIAESEQYYKSLFLNNIDATYILDEEGRILDLNKSTLKMIGYTMDELLHQTFQRLISPDHIETVMHALEKVKQGEAICLEFSIKHKNGHWIDVRNTSFPIINNHQVVCIIGISQDITEKKQIKQRLLDCEEQLQALINAVPDFIHFKDGEGRWLKANDFALSLFQLEGVPYVGKKDVELSEFTDLHRETLIKCADSDEHVWPSRSFARFEEVIPAPDGRTLTYDVIKVPIFNPDGSRKGLMTVGRDITERKRMEELNEYMAFHDPLTNIPNRRFFEKTLEKLLTVAKRKQEKLAVMYLDMDRFKYINDTLGHVTGDQMLKQISDRLTQCVNGKGLVARMGGDEFALLLPELQNVNYTIDVARQVIESVEKTFILDDYELNITTSVGISVYPHDGEDAHSLMKNADAALYRAKDQGKNNYQIYHSSMNAQTYKTFLLEKDLRKAMDRDEFVLYYQPRVDVITGRIVCMEALIRWHHPEWGIFSPDEFIPLAEETGLIIPIGEWVIRTACRQNRAWQEEGLPHVPISVNISPQQLMQKKNIIDNIQDILYETGLNPEWLEIEITENVLLENEERAISTMKNLQKMGIKIFLDDFGTGYSSLSYLKMFKVDGIKIDRSFIRDLSLNSEDFIIVKGIIQLVKSLNMTVIAEGVELEEQLLMLRRLNCDQVQGYLYSKPVHAGEFSAMLRKGKLQMNPIYPSTDRIIENRRKYFRVQLHFPLSSDMTITKINGNSLELGKTKVIVEDIGLGGLRFLSIIKLMVHREIILEIETEILGKTVSFIGTVVWFQELEDQIYQYGLEFCMNEHEQATLARLLNEFTIQLRKTPLVSNCRWIQTNKINYLKEHQKL